MEDVYQTIEKESQGYFKDKGSKFHAFAFPVKNEDEVKEIIARLRKEHHSARHHCFAWRLGTGNIIFRANDDGEPSSTAGKPILGQLQSFNVTNILVVVVRYFGGTLLGTGGLINAYRSATEDMLSHAKIIDKYLEDHFHIRFPYEKLNAVMKILKEEHIIPLLPEYSAACSMHIHVRKSISGRLSTRLSVIPGLIIKSG